MSGQQPEEQPIEYVGAPSEFAEAAEAPQWVQTAAKVLFFLPAALVTATTIPIIVITLALLCAACLCVFASALH
jgi:hypothetical protein